MVSSNFAERRALRGEQARTEALSTEADSLKSELARSQKDEQEQKELARVSDAAANAAQSHFEEQMDRAAAQFNVTTEALTHSLASCRVLGNRTAAALGQVRKELVSERAKLSLLEANVVASQVHLHRWQQLVQDITANYTGDRETLRRAVAEEAQLRREIASDEALLGTRTLELRQEKEGEHKLRVAYGSERQAHEDAATRAEAAIHSASSVWSVHLKDVSEREGLGSELRKTEAEVAAVRQQWRASDKKLHEAMEKDLRDANRQVEELNGSLSATLSERDRVRSDLKKLREEFARDQARTRALEKKMRDLQGEVDMGRSLVAKGVELIRQCRSAAAEHGREVEQEYDQKFGKMKRLFAEGLGKARHEMHDLGEKEKALQDRLGSENDAEERDRRILEEQKMALAARLAGMQQLRQRDDTALEVLHGQNLVLANQNKALNGNLISQHKALKNATDSIAAYEKNQELKNFDTLKALKNENSELVSENKALKGKLDTERAALARENAGLADENRALLKVVSELRQQVEATRRGDPAALAGRHNTVP